MTSNEEKKEVDPEQRVDEEPLSTTEQAVSSELNDSKSKEENGDEQQNNEDNGQATSQDNAKEEKEEEPTAKPVDKQPRKLRCIDTTETVDILVGEAGVATIKPVTVPEFFKKTVDKWPDVKALCWKDKKEDPWKSLTYLQYKKLIYNVAKSFRKVI